jgi:hypothetical protein
MVDDGQWEVASAKPVANRAPELPRMEDDGHESGGKEDECGGVGRGGLPEPNTL